MPDEPPVIESPVSDIPVDFLQGAADRFDQHAAGDAPVVDKAPEKVADKAPAKAPAENPDIPAHLLGEETPKEEPKVEDDDDLDKIEEPKFNTVSSGRAWKSLHERAKVYRAQRDELRAKVETLNVKAQASPDSTKYDEQIKQAEARIAELSTVIEKKAFESSPRYKALVDREKGSIEAAKGYLDGGTIPKRIIDLAADQTGAERLVTLTEAGMDTNTIAAIMPYLAQADSIKAEREKALAGHKEELARETAAETLKREQEEAQTREREKLVFSKVLTDATSKLSALKEVPGHEKWNAQVRETVARAEKIFQGGHSDEESALFAVHAAAYETQERLNTALTAKVKELSAKVNELTAKQPEVHGRRDGQPVVDPSKPFSFDDAGSRFEADPRLRG